MKKNSMEALKELQYRANWKIVCDFLQEVLEKSHNKGNLKFTQQVSKIKDLWVENYLDSIELLQELRAMNETYNLQYQKIMDQQKEIEELKELVERLQTGL